MKMSDILKFKKILENNKRILVFGRDTVPRRNTCLDIIAAYEETNQPIIIVGKDDYLIKEATARSGKIIYSNPKYSVVREVCWLGRSDLLIAFNYRNKVSTLELEVAMLANQALTDQGYKPLLIIDGLADFYNLDIDADFKTFYDEAIRMNITRNQPVVVSSNSFYSPANVNGILEISRKVISSADCMITTSEALTNNEPWALRNPVSKVEDILDRIKIRDSGIELKKKVKKIIDNDEWEKNERLLLDFNNGLLSTI